MMTSKAKAIEAFGRIKDVYRTHTINLQDVVDVQNQLNKPTLDDAYIKEIETTKKEHGLSQKKEKLLDLYQAVFGKSKPEYYEVSTQDLWSQIKKLERELNE